MYISELQTECRETTIGNPNPIGCDVNDIHWKYLEEEQDVIGNEYFIGGVHNAQEEYIEIKIMSDIIINTRCEHMDETCPTTYPKGKTICLQTNDYFSNEQHINCCKDLDDAIAYIPNE